ncbi:MAG: hypothetical protein WD011_07270 [Nitriliruptoraceae bacterium]
MTAGFRPLVAVWAFLAVSVSGSGDPPPESEEPSGSAPHGTELLDDDPVRVGLLDGSEISVGMQIEGAGGYHRTDLFDFEIPDSCVSWTGEVAHFNQQSPIQISE